MTTDRTMPEITAENAGFWRALDQGRIELQRCSDCGYVRHPPRWICPRCLSERSEWAPMSGTGVVFSLIWVHQPLDERFTDVPYNVAVVELEEGPRLISTVADVDPGQVSVGQRVTAEIRNDEGRALLVFRKDPA